MIIYNKLVRDKIPKIIENSGRKTIIKKLSEEEYYLELKKKSFEEIEEYIKADNLEDSIEELADLLEIIHALSAYHGTTIDRIEEVRRNKLDQRGSFKKRIFLVSVED